MKFHTVKKCLQCKFCEEGKRRSKSTYMSRDMQTIIIMCGATGRYQLISPNQLDADIVLIPDYCPLPDTDKDDGVVALSV